VAVKSDRVGVANNLATGTVYVAGVSHAILVVAIAVASSALANSPADLQKVTTAEQKWIRLGAVSYEYTLGVSVGGVFGWGEFKVTVKNGICTSRHIGGIGFGRPRFIERFRFARGCNVDGWSGVHLLPADLFREITEEVANGFVLKNLRVHPEYGFPVEASIDSDKSEDQGWGFTISDFKLTSRPNSDT
jgi:hypothetical protein